MPMVVSLGPYALETRRPGSSVAQPVHLRAG